MRPIKFRAWNHTDEKMIYPEQYESTYQQEIPPFRKVRGVQDFWFMSLSHEWELQQFTGLLDKNGKEIYEGDILRGYDDESVDGHIIYKYELLGIVEWDNERGRWIVRDFPSDEVFELYDYIGADEVIGNIYEHPELLKEEK